MTVPHGYQSGDTARPGPRSGQMTCVAAQMDDVSASEGDAILTPAQLGQISLQPSIAEWSEALHGSCDMPRSPGAVAGGRV